MSPAICGLIFILLGLSIRRRINSRTFNRRHSSERQLFSSYASSPFERFWTRLVEWLAVLLYVSGGATVLVVLSLS